MAPDRPRTALASLLRPRHLVTGWLWRSLAYLVTTLPAMAVTAVPLGVCALPLVVLVHRLVTGNHHALVALGTVSVLGLVPVVAVGPLWAVALAAVERRRLRLVDRAPVASGHRAPPPGLWPWLRTRFGEPATWREVAYAALLAVVLPVPYAALGVLVLGTATLAASPLLIAADAGPVTLGPAGTLTTPAQAVPYALAGLVGLLVVAYLAVLLAGGHGALARALLGAGADERLHGELAEIARSRTRLVTAFDTERRRIERDLHDGAQQRLVGLTLQLGVAQLDLPPGSPARAAVADAHDQAKQAMAELRELIHGIHPRVLTDRGLPAALRELADRCAVPVTVEAALPSRLPADVESTAYFVAAEALTNVVRHSTATAAGVAVRRTGTRLVMDIADNGRGGADPAGGTGLVGLADRIAVLAGTLSLSSPAGGPTTLHVELPCPPSA